MSDNDTNTPPRVTRVIVDGNTSDPGCYETIDASDGLIAALRAAGYTVTPA